MANQTLTIKMPAIRLLDKGRITLPAKLREIFGLKKGDKLETAIENTSIILKPKKDIDKSQLWYWSERWQKMEREADEDIKKGRVVGPFDTVEEVIKSLKD